MELSERVAELIAPTVEAMGYEVVRVQLSGKENLQLQVMIERQDGVPINVDHCAETSRAVSALLDVEDPIPGAYSLEVTSPGLDRPLVRRKDFERFAGLEVRAEMSRPIDGRRRFRGRLQGIEGDTVRMVVEGEAVDLPFAYIHRAKLVLNDELIAAAQARQEI